MKTQKNNISRAAFPAYNIRFKKPATRWDEGLPCGNGLLGALIWGDGRPLNISLDRSDLWDERPDPATQKKDFRWEKLVECLEKGDMASIIEHFEGTPGATPYPTKLPCGRMTLQFKKTNGSTFESALDMCDGIAKTSMGTKRVTSYVHAIQPLIIVQGKAAAPRVEFLSPFDRSCRDGAVNEAAIGSQEMERLNYPPPQRGSTKRGVKYVLQPCADGAAYAVAWRFCQQKKGWILFITVQHETNGRDIVKKAEDLLAEAERTGPAKLAGSHRIWWKDYWEKSGLEIPDKRLEQFYYAEMYKLGSVARKGRPPISLQGIWTADEMSLPPWRGDYHHDLNTQMSYWPVHTANRLEQSENFADWLAELLPRYRQLARKFFDAPGAFIPCAHSLAGHIIPGWAAYTFSRTNGAWVTQHLWFHYRYTLDEEFLRETAFPFIADVARFVVSQVEPDEKGIYHIHHSSSPEYFHNWRESFAKDSTYDLSLIRYVLEIASAAAKVLGLDRAEAREWDRIRSCLQPYHVSPEAPRSPAPEGGLAIWENQRLTESHRHPAQCMPIFPLGDLNVEGSAQDRQLIQNTLSELESMGTGFWCGYSFAWLACLGARIREPNRTVWALKQYIDAFISPNTFHLNGDFKRLGVCRLHYRPFTLEGGFGAAHAIQEMLIQSWGGRIRIFPAIPEDWRDVRFWSLRTEGAFLVSAELRAGEFFRAEIFSEKGGELCLDPIPGRKDLLLSEDKKRIRKWSLDQGQLSLSTKPGKRYTLTV
jgi:alpha-L-fucosidase 2